MGKEKKMKTYCGTRKADGCEITITGDGPKRHLAPRLDIWNHSPDGFEWGYGGSGPAQTALAILADALGDSGRAVKLHQDFKRRMIAGIATATWSMTVDQVMDVVKGIESK
jgi:hypothetical protein